MELGFASGAARTDYNTGGEPCRNCRGGPSERSEDAPVRHRPPSVATRRAAAAPPQSLKRCSHRATARTQAHGAARDPPPSCPARTPLRPLSSPAWRHPRCTRRRSCSPYQAPASRQRRLQGGALIRVGLGHASRRARRGGHYGERVMIAHTRCPPQRSCQRVCVWWRVDQSRSRARTSAAPVASVWEGSRWLTTVANAGGRAYRPNHPRVRSDRHAAGGKGTFLGGVSRHSSQSERTRFMCLSNAMKRPTMARPSSSVTLMR